MIQCKICASKNVELIYNKEIRNGGLGQYTEFNVPVYQCKECNVIWHENVIEDTENYYESTEYREALEGGSEEKQFYELHDKESIHKFQYTGTTIFRNKKVADIGCGCGAFLDYIKGVADEVIAVEPSETYRLIMKKKGFACYPYAQKAVVDYGDNIDVVVSFDVIEHVENPEDFLKDIFQLLKEGGQAIIGTPTDAPVMRRFLGEIYEKQILFSTQHLWIFSEENLKLLAMRSGFSDIKIKYYQRYGMDNMLAWINNKSPKTEIDKSVVTDTMDSVWRSQMCEKGLGDYIILYLKK